ncbi:MAG: hypothetical protein WA865_07000 [Spirulinaceae cyanobacterium]
MSFELNYQKCLEKLTWATEKLQVQVELAQLIKVTELIVQTMTGAWRYYHNTEHILKVGGTDNPIEVLAALFHDIVYVQIDRSFHFNFTYYLAPFIKQGRTQLIIRDHEELPQDIIFEMVIAIFGYNPGEILSPRKGQNEFLSALVAGKVLESFLTLAQILQVVVCIEATIPFRCKSSQGLTPSEKLYEVLKYTNSKFEIGLTEQEIILTIKSSVKLANRDILSFASPRAATFLDETWNLLAETHPSFKNINSYTVKEYRVALQKTAKAMYKIEPSCIFRQFQGQPEPQDYQILLETARKNLRVARLYLTSKLFTIAIIEALSTRIGKGISLAVMVGELPGAGADISRLANFIPILKNNYICNNDIELEVLNLLQEGRIRNSFYDIKDSPLTTFIVKSIGFDSIKGNVELMNKFFQRKIASEDFLTSCNTNVTEAITQGIVQLTDVRQELLLKRLQ